MKKLTLFLLALLTLSPAIKAQSENGYEPFSVMTDFHDNAFTFFRTPLLLMSGDKTGSNAMTIGWGSVGTLWGKPTITVFVAEKRHTRQFLERAKHFSVMKISEKVLEYMGSHSGRDGDKTKALGLHVAYTENGAPYYTEATEVYECSVLYGAPFSKEGFRDQLPTKFYQHFGDGIHSVYIGEVTGAWRKNK